MHGAWLLLAAAGLMMFSGMPAGFGPRASRRTQPLAVTLMLLGSLTGWLGLAAAWRAPGPCALSMAWSLPWGRFAIGLDALSAVFLIPVFTIPALGSVYGLAYWRQAEHPENGRGLSLFYGLLAGAMALVVLARDSVLLLIAWEVMALAAFFLATTENDKPEVRRAGWIYLVATHIGTVCLLALFALLRKASGDFALETLPAGALTDGLRTALFILAVVGFGFKAGLMPLHVWLPGAHANAPSHVSAVLSGVMLKMGIYGILRMLALLPVTELWNGAALLGLGAVTGVLGIAFALGQSDLKRLLAYSSIENIGLVTMGIGLALIGRVQQRADLVLLGLAGALLHVWNHGLFKSLLFLNAGAILHAVPTRDMNQMGGLARRMPHTAGLFLLGALAICGLPPLNGFAGEWLLYLGLFRSAQTGSGTPGLAAGLGAVALALIGAMALACFVKGYSSVFLGRPRRVFSGAPHDPPAAMRTPMLLLAAGCVALGLLPQLGLPLLEQAAAPWIEAAWPRQDTRTAMATIRWIGVAALALLLVAGAAWRLLRTRLRRPAGAVDTWGCGYAQPTPRIQYTATSFGEMLVGLWAWALRPRTQPPAIDTPFPPPDAFATEVPDVVLDRAVRPFFRQAGRQMMKLRLLQQGRTHIYLLYILVMLLFLLCWERMGIGR